MNRLTNKGWLAWFAHNPVAANLLMMTLLVVGGITAFQIRTEGFPAEKPNNVTISASFSGGSPEDVEESIAIRIEDALGGVTGIKKISSSVSERAATVTVRGEEGYPPKKLQDEIKARVEAISSFPRQVQKPVVSLQQEDRHVINIQVYGDTDHGALKETARRVRQQLLQVNGISNIITNGARTPEITIEVREEKLRVYGLGFGEVARAIKNTSINLSAGAIRTAGATISLQSRQKRYHASEFENIVIRSTPEGGIIRLRDIANVHEGYTEQAIISRFQGQPSINLDVMLVGRDSITDISSRVQSSLEEIQKANWIPDQIHIATWNDEADIIRGRLGLLSKNALMGMALVLVILAVFLNARIAFWVALGIPVSFAGTLMVMGPGFLDYSLNDLTTFAFIIVLGIVVDDAIVIGESIHTHQQRSGDSVDVTIRGAKEVATPATFGVLTTVAAFYPLTTITGDFGGPFRMIAVVTIVCLLFSLVESKLILPAHLARAKPPQDDNSRTENMISKTRLGWSRFQRRVDHWLVFIVTQYYEPMMVTVIRNRYQALGVFVAILVLATGFVTSGVLRTVFFEDWESDFIYADIKMRPGSPASDRFQVAKNLEASLKTVNEEIKIKYNIRQNPVIHYYTSSAGDEDTSLVVQLMPGSVRPFSGNELASLWRQKIGLHPDVRHIDFYTGADSESDLRIEILSQDKQVMDVAAADLKQHLVKFDGVHDIRTNLDNYLLELEIRLKPEAEALGLTYQAVTGQIRNAIYGVEVQRLQRKGEEVQVLLRYPKRDRDNLSDLDKIRVQTPGGEYIPLFAVADLLRSKKPQHIERIDGRRVSEIIARVNKDRVSPAAIVEDLEYHVFPELAATYPGITFRLSGEAEAEEEATGKLVGGFVMGLLIIYALLAIPLKSYTAPFVIMLAIPFGIVGAVIGHLIIGIPMSLLSFFGVLALSGVVVNDSLVLVSRYTQIRHATKPAFEEAVIEAGASRFRAVLLTSITTFAGLFPLILERSEQAQLLIPMAVSLAFGILFATLITLMIIPVLLGVRQDILELQNTPY